MVRTVRTSTRPCPLSTVVATRSGGGGGGGASAGGSGRRDGSGGVLEGEGGLDVHLQRLLVVLHHQQVIAPGIDDLRGQVPLAEQGVADHHLSRHGQNAEEFQSGLVFVRLGVHADLGEDGLGVRGEGGHQVDAGHVAVAGAAQGLAVEGQVFGVGRVDPGGHPAGEDGLDGVGVEGGQGAGQGGQGRRLLAGEAEGGGQSGAVLAAEPGDAGQTRPPHQQGQGDHPQDGRQRMPLAVSAARVGEGGQFVEQGRSVHAGHQVRGKPDTTRRPARQDE